MAELARLASNSSASTSRYCVPECTPLRAMANKRAGRPNAAAPCKRSLGLRPGGMLPQAARRRVVVCKALEAVDYSFYQRLPPGEFSEQYLWEQRLRPLLGYLPAPQERAVREALSLAYDAHGGQKRRSGEPFITHPVEVARILAELQMDYESLVAGLLHDTVEDCGSRVKLAEIEFNFGPSVRRIVEGETKFSKLPRPPGAGGAPAAGGPQGCLGSEDEDPGYESDDPDDPYWDDEDSSVSSRWRKLVEEASMGSTAGSSDGSGADGAGRAPGGQDVKAKDLQFLFLAMTEEVRIIVVKLADRLHNMRTMGAMPPYKQRRIAQETLQVFAPLARLLGLYSIKEELEELSFKYALPEQYALMRRHLGKLWEVQQSVVDAARAELEARLAGDAYLASRISGVGVEAGRKSLYSTWRKLQSAGKSVKDVSDIAQLRVVLEPATGEALLLLGSATSDRQLCYHVMGLVHSFWAPIPGSMKDYMATPKLNNYQSLHTTVVPTGLEVPAPGRRPTRPSSTLFPIEVQIRTREMDRLAQFGIAVDSWSSADFGRQQQDVLAVPTAASWTASGNGSSLGSSSNGTSADGAASQAKQSSNGNGSGSGASKWLPWGLGRLLSSGYKSSDNGSSSSSDDSNGAGPRYAATSPNASANGASCNGAGLNGASANGARPSSGSSGYGSNGSGPYYAGGPGLSGSSPYGSSSSSSNGVGLPHSRLDAQALSRRINWLNSIRSWQQEFLGMLTASEFVACVTDDLLGQGVFVFTPLGQVMRLPKGATVVDFAYHIHTAVGNSMVAAKVNGKLVDAAHELQNAEVVEIIQYTGQANPRMIQKHRQWLDCAQTKTARHKIAKFLREQVSKGLLPPGAAPALGDLPLPAGAWPEAEAEAVALQAVWLRIQCEDRTGLLADVSHVIARYQHNIRSYAGSFDHEAGLFQMEYELEGRADLLQDMCSDLSSVPGVTTWAVRSHSPSEAQRGPDKTR